MSVRLTVSDYQCFYESNKIQNALSRVVNTKIKKMLQLAIVSREITHEPVLFDNGSFFLEVI